MDVLTLKSLTFSGIGRFVEEQTIDFTQLGSLVQVEGHNGCTGASSGAGKSTIFKALDFLLGLNDISNSVLQSRLTKSPMSVTGLFDLDGQSLKIERNKKLLIDLDGEITTGSSKLTEEKLDGIIGMPRDLFRKILHKRQAEGGFFLDMGPTDVHKFLTSCLGLEKEQAKILTLDNRLEALETKYNAAHLLLEQGKTGVEATKESVLILGPSPALEVTPEVIEELKIAHLGARDTHTLVKESHRKEMADLETSRPKIETVPFDRTKILELESRISTVVSQMTAFEDNEKQRCGEAKAKISELQILSAKLTNVEQTRQSEVKNQISAAQVQIAKIQGAEQSRQSTVKASISALQIELIRAQAKVTLGVKAKEDAMVLAKELQSVRSAVCPTCSQGWVNDTCKAKEAQILAKLLEYKKVVIDGTEAQNKITLDNERLQVLKIEAEPKPTLEVDTLNEKIAKLKLDSQPQVVPEVVELSYQIENLKKEAQPQLIAEVVELSKEKFIYDQMLGIERKAEQDHQFNKNAESQVILAIWAEKQTALRKTHEDTLQYVQDKEKSALALYETAKNKAKSFEDSKARFDSSLGKLQEQLDKYQLQLDTKSIELTYVQDEVELATESKKAIKSYLSCSFEDALDSIGDVATRLIRAIPNMSTATIQFEGLKETKEGKIKEEVTCLISMDGEIGIPVKSLSGGERSSTDLAIDLSVIKFIEERTGKGIDLMVLDEPFTGLDTTNVFEALEMLKECSSDKRLLIVDHNPVASQSIESRLKVIRDGLTSRVVQE